MPPILPLIGLALGAGALLLAGGARARDGDLIRPLPAETGDLSAYRWEKRPVVIFGASAEDPDVRRQIEMLSAVRSGLRDRDIVVLTDTDPKALGRLRTGLALEGFAVLLVGKDGGVKLREDHPVTPDRLFALIDRMPMRQREMTE